VSRLVGCGLLALAVLAVPAAALEGPEVEVKPIRKIWMLDAGACEVDVTFRLEIKDGGDERYYCPEVEWEWEDGTRSISESDCPPFDEADTDRRFVRRQTHSFTRGGHWVITVRLSKAGELFHEEEADVVIAGDGLNEEERAHRCR
jgi:hypothetical protein